METPVSLPTLIKATTAALTLAVTVLVLIILPAEYDIDPTGVGAVLGLTVLADSSASEAPVTANQGENLQPGDDSDYVPPSKQRQQKLVEVVVPAQGGIEYKFAMGQYDKMTYEWSSQGTLLYFDLHGEPEGDTTGYFESYAEATLDGMRGSFTAPFTGSHGWYWKNISDQPVTVKLSVSGQFEVKSTSH